LSNVVAVAAGDYHSMALRADGTIVAWGYNPYGQTNVPVGLTNVVAIAAGGSHSVALRGDGRVITWGLNTAGQTNVPATVTNAIAISAGESHTLALLRSAIRVPPYLVNVPTPFTAQGFGIEVDSLYGHGPIILFASTNLTDWVPLLTNPPVVGNLQLRDSSATNLQTRFYRAVEQ
jgi:hypothetical protein